MLFTKENKSLGYDINPTYYNELLHISLLLTRKGFEVYLVGGCVRDMLLGKEPKDYDLTTSATPEQVKKVIEEDYTLIFPSTVLIETGIKHGTLTIHNNKTKSSYEITTYRVDGNYSDGRHPDEVSFTASLEEDLKRRDFTINSLAYDILKGELIMLDESFLDDLKMGIIRCVGNSDQRFTEDALRMLRAIRFSAQLGSTIEFSTLEAIKNNAYRIIDISKERIKVELEKIICSDNPQMLELLVATSLDLYIMPQLRDMLECQQFNKYHYTDVLHHTFDVMKNIPKSEIMLRWSALFHDMGKPNVKSIDENGDHFYGHELVSADYVKKYTEELKFDNKTSESIYKIVKYHSRDIAEMRNSTFKKLINTVGQDLFEKYIMFKQADALAHNLSASDYMTISDLTDMKVRYLQIIKCKEPMSLKDLCINGKDAIAVGVVGKSIGEALNECLNVVIEHPDMNTRKVLLGILEGFKQ